MDYLEKGETKKYMDGLKSQTEIHVAKMRKYFEALEFDLLIVNKFEKLNPLCEVYEKLNIQNINLMYKESYGKKKFRGRNKRRAGKKV